MVRICTGEVCVRSSRLAGDVFPGAPADVEIKRVHVVAHGMKLRNVERFEIVIRRFDFRAFDDGKSDGDENVFDFLEDLTDQMMRADGPRSRRVARDRRVRGLQQLRFRAGFDRNAARFDLRFDVRAKFVERCADGAFEFRSRGLQPIVGDLREDAGFAAQPGIAEKFPGGFVVYVGSFGVESRN